MRQDLEDVTELMHHIQLRLPVEEAARTSVLSKSWLYAWSTIPYLRFDLRTGKKLKLVDVGRSLTRYLHDSIPVESFDLKIDIENQESACDTEKWIGAVATKTSLKEIFLMILLRGDSVTLPDEILASENLTRISILAPLRWRHSVWMTAPVFKCVSLKELHLEGVRISEKALHDILSSSSSLVTIEILQCCCKEFKTIKVKNLARLHSLKLSSEYAGYEEFTTLEISDVPNLGVLSYDVHFERGPDMPPIPFNAHSISLGNRVTQLMLGVIQDNACLDKIKSGFPCLKKLTLHMRFWKLGSFLFTCASIKRLSLYLCPDTLIDVQIHAPKLLFFEFRGTTLPRLLFPVSHLKQINLSLALELPVDASFFLKMREALNLSRKCNVHIESEVPLDNDIGDLQTRLVLPPATNVQELWFKTSEDECKWERSAFFDAFFQICHPKRVFARPDTEFRHNNHFGRLMLREFLEKKTTSTGTPDWPHYLKHVQIRRTPYENWETLTNSHRRFLDGSTHGVSMHFNLRWR